MFSTGDILTPEKKEIVVITGGSGFLGQHIVRQIQQHTAHVGEIRILDVKPVQKFMEYDDLIPTKTILSSVNDICGVRQAIHGADSVIHVAGLISYGTFPDINGMEKINIEGTRTVIEACIKENIERLIFCSTVDVVIGHKDITNGTEETGIPDDFLFPGYPDTKFRAERLILEANGTRLNSGMKIHTISLRPNVMYGEGDPYYVTTALRNARDNNGVLIRVGDGSALFQQTYVGNAAWAFLCADAALKNNPSQVSGQVFFVPDDTPLQNTFTFMNYFLKDQNLNLSRFYLPWKFVYVTLYFMELVLKALKPLVKLNLPAQSCSVKYINMNLYFSPQKSRQLLGYKPFYSPHQSLEKSALFYKNFPL
ncbi:hypothetical protein SNE40_002684 [Patella caerulea]|uniref:3-beta hydroxysteroid dehydrogenase/isomerase domain-containing protein n=1 Tax=Patella caerulea TaxID=87958 RepID=A0AAN8K957_PATCE